MCITYGFLFTSLATIIGVCIISDEDQQFMEMLQTVRPYAQNKMRTYKFSGQRHNSMDAKLLQYASNNSQKTMRSRINSSKNTDSTRIQDIDVEYPSAGSYLLNLKSSTVDRYNSTSHESMW